MLLRRSHSHPSVHPLLPPMLTASSVILQRKEKSPNLSLFVTEQGQENRT